MTDLSSAFEQSRVPPYVRLGAAEFAAAIAERKAHTGAISSAVDLPRSVAGRKAEGWQTTIMRYDQDGPGFVGWVLDVKSFLASLIPIIVQERTPDGNWVSSDDPTVNVAAHSLRNDEEDTPELIARWYRLLDSVGECWVALGDSDFAGIEVELASINQVEWINADAGRIAVILTRPDQSKQDPAASRIPAELMMRSWHKRSDWPDLPTSQWKRAIPDIERYIATRRNITRVLNSRLVTNGLLHFHVPQTAAVNPATPGAAGPVPKVIHDYASMTSRAIRNDDDEAAFAPFPLWGDKAPEWVEVGRMLDPVALEAEVAALQAIGRSINFPLQLLVEGPGAGNHWSDVFLNEQFLSQDVAGTLELVLHDATLGPFRRILDALFKATKDPRDTRKFRLWYDLTDLGGRLDDGAAVLDQYLAGLISAKGARARLRIAESEAPLPGDLPASSSTVVNRAGSNLLPGAPQRAAVQTIPRADIRKVTADLNSIDANLFLALDGVAQRTVRAIIIACGRQLLAALPPGDPQRVELETLPVERVWAAASRELRSLVDTRAVVEAYVAPAQQEAEDELSVALIALAAVFVGAGLVAPETRRNVDPFRDQFADGLSSTADQQLELPTVPVQRAGIIPPRWSPTAVARTAMERAAGAIPDLDPDGRPQLPDGTWVGGSGPATGPDAIEALRLEFSDLAVSYRWDHGDPKDPFLPHLALDGTVYTNADRLDKLANLNDNGVPNRWPSPIFHPGDHAGCTCNEEIILTTTLS